MMGRLRLFFVWSCLCLSLSRHAHAFAPIATTTTTTTSSSSSALYATESNNKGQGKTAVIAGATGYIGRSVVRESVRQGYQTFALVRDKTKTFEQFQGATIVECDVCDEQALQKQFADISAQSKNNKIDAIVSCLASRSGVKKDAFKIDYQATLNCLEAGRAVGARHFVLLSAFCVKNPWLQFQLAKLQFEDKLANQQSTKTTTPEQEHEHVMTYTIVRPTAFFKSVSGQLEAVQGGAPYVMFGDGTVTQCNPIAESDLATYLMDSVTDSSRCNKIINLGGPDQPLTMRKQGEMLFQAVGIDTPKFINAPLWLFDAIINTLQFLANVTGSESLEDAAETGRIGKYYAVESMLTTDPNEKFGTITLQEHYNRIAVEGQEYDPYTSMFAMTNKVTKMLPTNGEEKAVVADASSREKVESSSSSS